MNVFVVFKSLLTWEVFFGLQEGDHFDHFVLVLLEAVAAAGGGGAGRAGGAAATDQINVLWTISEEGTRTVKFITYPETKRISSSLVLAPRQSHPELGRLVDHDGSGDVAEADLDGVEAAALVVLQYAVVAGLKVAL